MKWIRRRILSDFKDLQLILTLVGRRKTEDTLPSSSDASVISYQRQTKEQENYKPISLMNKDSKILSKILVNRHISKRFPWWPSWLYPWNAGVVQHMQAKKCNRLTIWVDPKTKSHNHLSGAEKIFYIIQHAFMMKILENIGAQGTDFNIIKAIYIKETPQSTSSF